MISSLSCSLVNTITAVTQAAAMTPTGVRCHRESFVVSLCEAGTGGGLSSSASINSVCPWKVFVAGARPQRCAERLSSQHWTLSSLLGRKLSFKENIPSPRHLLISGLCECTTSGPTHGAREGGVNTLCHQRKAATHGRKLQSTTYHLVKRHTEI